MSESSETSPSPSPSVPLISSGVAGPIGILHLPRLWQKTLLGATGKLHPAYTAAGQGFDQMVLDAIGVNREEFLSYIASKLPTYLELEEWVVEKREGKIDASAVEQLNRTIANYEHRAETRKAILEDCGILDNGAIVDALTLNNLDDWNTFHDAFIA
ncbi:MAG: DUF5069 domain-containing protein [Verrucomicrobiota bacterium]